MFAEFENMVNKVTTSLDTNDFSKTPQKYNIDQKEIKQLKLLSQGSFGFIWLAQDVHSKQKYALKRVICQTQQNLKSAELEKQLMSRLPRSAHLVGYEGGSVLKMQFDGMSMNVVVTLMELCPNGTLYDLLEKHQHIGFTQADLLQMIKQILLGLQTIHSLGYYHRDVKIENVLLGQNNLLKLCDFGSCTDQVVDFAKIHSQQYENIKEQINKFTTPMYRPPEVVDPYLHYKVSSKADIWMLGCVLYTLNYFTHPFINSNSVGIASGTYQLAQSKYKVSQKMKDLIRHMLTPNPAYRPDENDLLSIITNWSSLREIPLNSEAKNRKIQQMQKQRQMEHLNRKVIDNQGDISIEQLIRLQIKLQSKNEDTPTTSFIKKKQNQLPKTVSSIAKPVQQKKDNPHKKIDTSDAIWNSVNFGKSNSTVKKNADFNAFNNLWDIPKPSNKVLGQQTFSNFSNFNDIQNETKNNKNEGTVKKQSENLLDL